MNAFNQTLNITCNFGYTLLPGISTIGAVCLASGVWSIDLNAFQVDLIDFLIQYYVFSLVNKKKQKLKLQTFIFF